jgi:gamma-glutamylcyclotransferase (GGCT)/AIG2-like uncharacterized protein YtfP
MKIPLFVYGTLKRGFPLHKHLKEARFLGEAELSNYLMYDLGWYPGIVPGPGKVRGEVYEVSLATLALLDEIEAEGEEYERRLLPVRLSDGRTIEAFVYIYLGEVSRRPLVKEGVWEKKTPRE